MTAPKRSAGAPIWHSRGYSLSAEAKTTLIEALGFPADSQDPQLFKCLQMVEHWLGFYPGGKDAIDNAPSAAVYVKELKAVKKSAVSLMVWLNSPDKGINPFTRDTLCAHFEEAVSMTGPDGIAKATIATASVVIACSSALKALETEKRTGRGRKKAGAREVVLTKLLELFGHYSKRRHDKRARKGAIESLSNFETHELQFVRNAFRDIQADTFADTHGDQKWLSLIRSVRPRQRKKAS